MFLKTNKKFQTSTMPEKHPLKKFLKLKKKKQLKRVVLKSRELILKSNYLLERELIGGKQEK